MNPQDLVGKTIAHVDAGLSDCWILSCEDETQIAIQSDIKGMGFSGTEIKLLNLSVIPQYTINSAIEALGQRSWSMELAEQAVDYVVDFSQDFGITCKTTYLELASIAGNHWVAVLKNELEENIG